MKQNWWKLLIVAALVVAVVVVVAAKNRDTSEVAVTTESSMDEPSPIVVENEPEAVPEPAEQEPVAEDAAPVETIEPKPKPTPVEKPAAPVKPTPKPEPVVKVQQAEPAPKHLPKMIELGADKCIPCKMMQPIIEELRKEYKGKLEIVFIDVWKDSSAGEKYGIQSIPTQVFLDEKGKEFFRHTGFFPKEDILKTFREHGVKLD